MSRFLDAFWLISPDLLALATHLRAGANGWSNPKGRAKVGKTRVATRRSAARWQERIYAFLTQSAVRAPDYFLIPPPQVVELGTRVEM